ncbi:MAG: hypothetical protein JO290_06940 [Sphingomonadaceae bacterium]|nr:hypothetical protein [Sphingomonadaceae bacterium]
MATTDCHLYRSLRYDDFGQSYAGTEDTIPDGLLYPRWRNTNYTVSFRRGGRVVEEERVSRADVRYNPAGEVRTGGGTSLFDVEGWFGSRDWHYFRIPEGTTIPDSLVVQGPGPEQSNGRPGNGARTGHHYQIEVRVPMTVEAMKGALDTFLRSAIAKNVQLAQTA